MEDAALSTQHTHTHTYTLPHSHRCQLCGEVHAWMTPHSAHSTHSTKIPTHILPPKNRDEEQRQQRTAHTYPHIHTSFLTPRTGTRSNDSSTQHTFYTDIHTSPTYFFFTHTNTHPITWRRTWTTTTPTSTHSHTQHNDVLGQTKMPSVSWS